MLEAPASAGILFPGVERVELQGLTYRARELKVRHVAKLERLAEEATGHPFRGLEGVIEAASAATPFDDAKVDHLEALARAEESWPPRLGSPLFWRAIGAGSVAPTFLRLALRPTRPRLTAAHTEWLADAMDAKEWAAIDSVAWGKAPMSPHGGSHGRGVDWGKCFDHLVKKLTPDAIGNLYLTPFFKLVSEGGTYAMELPDRPEGATSAPGIASISAPETGSSPSDHSG